MLFRRHTRSAEYPQSEPAAITQTPTNPKRPLLIRLFGVKFWGAVRLTALCVLVGIVQKIGWAEKTSRDVDILPALQAIWENTFHGLIWVIRHGWQPALMGATIVIPIWIIWRLISLPFRK